MSFTSDFLEAEKKKKKNQSTGDPFTDQFLSFEADKIAEQKGYIAPVRETVESTVEAPIKRTWLTGGAFSDGYQFGDVTKTIIGTTQDLTENVAAGILGMGEKTIDAGAYLVGATANLFGADEFADKTKEFIAKDLYDEEELAKVSTQFSPLGLLTNKVLGVDSERDSILGERTDSLAQSGGQLLGTIGLQAVGVPWFVTSGVTSFGGEVEGALGEDASYLEAGTSGVINAGAEILTEKLFGGSGLGEKGIINLDGFTKGISSKVVKALADYGVDMAAEGSEEFFSSVIGKFGEALYSEKNLDELLLSEEAFDEYLERPDLLSFERQAWHRAQARSF